MPQNEMVKINIASFVMKMYVNIFTLPIKRQKPRSQIFLDATIDIRMYSKI